MNTTKRRLLLAMLKMFNLGAMGLSAIFATILLFSDVRKGMSLTDFLSMRVKLGNFAIAAITLGAWHFIFWQCGFYRSTRLAKIRSLLLDTAKATTLATLCFAVVAQLFSIRMATSRFLVLFWVLSSVSLLSTRITIRYVLQTVRRRGLNLRNMLILGTNSRAVEFAAYLATKSELGYRVLGFVDDEWPGLQEFGKSAHTLCCNFDDVLSTCHEPIIGR